MRQPKDLAEAKQIFREEKTKVTGSLSALAGSRWLLAILATLAIAFGAHLIYAPTRLPTVGGLSLAQTGLPPNIDFGAAGEQAQQAIDAAEREGARERAQQFITENEDRAPLFNAIGLGATMLLLAGNLWIMTKRRRSSRG